MSPKPFDHAGPRGLSVESWVDRRGFVAADYSAQGLLASKQGTVSVVLPAREVAGTIGSILETLIVHRDSGLIDELVVIDSDSRDATADIAQARGATVHQRAEIHRAFGPPQGKGDGIWRGLAVTTGDVVAFMDTDTQNFDDRFLLGLLGPLLEDPTLHFVKGAFRRPLQIGEVSMPDEGGRVTELVARPLLNLYVPQLAGFIQPLAGEVAARRTLLEAIPIPVGYGVEIGMLIDSLHLVGLEALGQVDLGTRKDLPQPLRDLTGMAYAVAATILSRAYGPDELSALDPGRYLIPGAEGVDIKAVSLEERPPLNTVVEEDAAG